MENGKKVKCLADGVIYTNDTADDLFSKYQVESEWEIVEHEEQPRPCLYCTSEDGICIHCKKHENQDESSTETTN